MSDPDYRPPKVCSDRGGYEMIPVRRTTLDLGRVRRVLEASGTEVLDARVLLIVRTEPEATVHENGRVLVKSADLGTAEATFDRLRTALRAGTGDSSRRVDHD